MFKLACQLIGLTGRKYDILKTNHKTVKMVDKVFKKVAMQQGIGEIFHENGDIDPRVYNQTFIFNLTVELKDYLERNCLMEGEKVIQKGLIEEKREEEVVDSKVLEMAEKKKESNRKTRENKKMKKKKEEKEEAEKKMEVEEMKDEELEVEEKKEWRNRKTRNKKMKKKAMKEMKREAIKKAKELKEEEEKEKEEKKRTEQEELKKKMEEEGKINEEDLKVKKEGKEAVEKKEMDEKENEEEVKEEVEEERDGGEEEIKEERETYIPIVHPSTSHHQYEYEDPLQKTLFERDPLVEYNDRMMKYSDFNRISRGPCLIVKLLNNRLFALDKRDILAALLTFQIPFSFEGLDPVEEDTVIEANETSVEEVRMFEDTVIRLASIREDLRLF
uniref:SPK domain-containing protein n=1 Tax=Caenorhabditis tropicalis TaxID=1561998 RepID=A0A1I7TUC9_9PELO